MSIKMLVTNKNCKRRRLMAVKEEKGRG